MSEDCAKNWYSISLEMAKYLLKSPYSITELFTHVLLINCYRNDSPRIEKEIESITIGKAKKVLCPDKWLDTDTELHLSSVWDIVAYVAGYIEEKYIILCFDLRCIKHLVKHITHTDSQS